jgi:hypothetical protein
VSAYLLGADFAAIERGKQVWPANAADLTTINRMNPHAIGPTGASGLYLVLA